MRRPVSTLPAAGELEALAHMVGTADGSIQPPGPVIGRRFAQAHRRVLRSAGPAQSPATVRRQPCRTAISRHSADTQPSPRTREETA